MNGYCMRCGGSVPMIRVLNDRGGITTAFGEHRCDTDGIMKRIINDHERQ